MPSAEFFTPFGLLTKREFFDAELCEKLRREMVTAPGHASLVAESTADAVDEDYRRTVTARVSVDVAPCSSLAVSTTE